MKIIQFLLTYIFILGFGKLASCKDLCPSGYEHPSFHTMCIRRYTRPDELASWFDAKNICAKDSAQLFILPNNEEYLFSENEIWSDSANDGKSGKILWKRNSHINDINNLTSRIREESQCFMYKYRKKNLIKLSSDCRERRGFRCAISQKMYSLAKVPWCPQGWFGSDLSYMKEKCYFFHFPQTHTYDRAEEHCGLLGAHLVVVKKKFYEAFDWALSLLPENDYYPLTSDSCFWSALIVKDNIAYWNTSIGLRRFKGSWDETKFEEEYEDVVELRKEMGESEKEEDNLAGMIKFDESQWKLKITEKILLRRMAKRTEAHGFICEKSAMNRQRSPRASLTRRLNTERTCIELICKGKFVHPVSLIYWYVNNERITEWNTVSGFHLHKNHTYFFRSEIQDTKCLDKTDRTLQGEFHCEIGGSDSIDNVISNKIMVLFSESNRRIVSIDVKDNETSITHNKIKEMLQKLRTCEASDIKIEEIRLFQREESINIVVHVENYGSDESWKPFESCLNQTKKDYLYMDFHNKNPSKCISKPIKIMGRNSQWPTTTLNNNVEPDKPCISAKGNIIKRKCSGDFIRGAFWEPFKEHCDWNVSISTIFFQHLSKTPLSKKNITKLTEELWNLTEETEQLVAAEINYIAKILKIISVKDTLREKAVVDVAYVVDRLINTTESILETDNNYSVTASSITKSLETIVMKSDSNISIDKPSFYAESVISGSGDIVGVSFVFGDLSHFHNIQVKLLTSRNSSDSNQTAVTLILPQKFRQHHGSGLRMSFIIYNDSRLFPVSSPEKYINSFIVSAAVENTEYYLDTFSPIQLTFQPHQSDIPFEKVSCMYWDYSLNDERGDWSDEGCWLDGIREGKIICLCEHLSHFAVLMDFAYQDKSQSSDHTFHLTVITYIGCAFSILGLSLTIITFTLFKPWRKKLENKVICNLSVSLLCVLVIFLSGFEQVNSPKTCIAVAVLLHYFLLAAFGWMLVEGIFSYLRFVRVFNSYVPKFMMKSMICAWGLPLVVVSVVLCIDVDLYKGSPDYCWMSRNALIGSFLFPIGIIIVLNTIIFVLIIKSISCNRRNVVGKKYKKFLELYASIIILILLGLTWVFGFFAVHKYRTFFQFLFCICNSFQGFLIFACMVVRDNNAQDLWAALLLKREYFSTIRRRTKNKDETLSTEVRSFSTEVRSFSTEVRH